MSKTLVVEIIQVGDELGFIIPDKVIKELGLSVGDDVQLTIAAA